jgi:tetratricopeptide (TPR) repeat protein
MYSGHNEWAERRYYSRLIEMDPRLFSLRERLFDTRLFVLLSRLALPPQASPEEAIDRYVQDERREFFEMFAVFSRRVQGEDYASEAEVEQRDLLFRTNLEAIVRAVRSAGATPLLLTVSQNFADWSPGASVHRPGLGDLDRRRFDALLDEGNRAAAAADCGSALRSYEAALAIDDEFADLHYRLAECHRTLGDTAAARARYRRASDLDRVPHGAPTYFNDVIREIAREQALLLVDADELLTEESDDGLVGNDLFVEFAHPNLRAHQRIGAAIAETLREAGIPRAPGAWRNSGYADPDPASLYEADPELRAREHQSWKVVCALARRPECVERHTRALLELRGAVSKAGAP